MNRTRFYFSATSALIRIDVQKTFCPGGKLPVHKGDEIVKPLSTLSHHASRSGAAVVDTQDWHPANHKSFASTHDKNPFDVIQMAYGPQVLWPVHGVQGTEDAEFHPDLDTDMVSMVVRKGMNPEIDSYSAFFENDKVTPTGLGGYLRQRGVKRVYLAGLAYDFCVGFSALDAVKEGFEEVVVIRDLCRAIDLNGSEKAMTDQLARAGVWIVNSHEIRYVK